MQSFPLCCGIKNLSRKCFNESCSSSCRAKSRSLLKFINKFNFIKELNNPLFVKTTDRTMLNNNTQTSFTMFSEDSYHTFSCRDCYNSTCFIFYFKNQQIFMTPSPFLTCAKFLL